MRWPPWRGAFSCPADAVPTSAGHLIGTSGLGETVASDFKKLLADARLPERSVPVCMRGDLVADHEALERQLQAAQDRPVDSLEGNGVGQLVDRIEALQDEMRDHSYQFRLRALPRQEFRALVAAHPPRRDDGTGDPVQDDAVLGVNRDTFFTALIRACVQDPQLDDAEWVELLDEKLTDRQFMDLADAAWFVNRGEVDVPFSHAASRAKRSSEPG
jgi:hypothetical protein